jgi:DNA-binding SARP family transcriptional activator
VAGRERRVLTQCFAHPSRENEAMPETPLSIRLFGPLEVRLHGEPPPRPIVRKAAWTLALLVLRHDRVVERDWLAGTLWPESAAGHASYNLRRSLSQLRHVLGPEAWRIATPSRHTLSFDHSGADVDLVCFDEAIQGTDSASLARAVAAYGGPLLEGCIEEWVLAEREAREQAYLGALERLASELFTRGDAASAVAYLRRALAVDPLRESVQRMLLEALAAQGEYAEAVQSYRALRLLLWEELRTEPSAETRAVYERTRAAARDNVSHRTHLERHQGRPSDAALAGALPPVWNVPHRRNPHFTGREALLLEMEAASAAGGPAALAQALLGLGGIGKTQLALEYAYRHAGDYHVVWWVRGEEPSQLRADYAALATVLDLPEKRDPDQGIVVSAVQRWLEHNSRWLLIVDNAPGPAVVADHLPRAGMGHVLITSRDQSWAQLANPVPVPVLPHEEAVALLERRTGWSGPAVDALAQELGQLPLALEQGAAYAAATGCSPETYLGLLRSRRQALLQRERPPEGYQGTIATTWGVSMAEARQECPAAAELLRLCAYLAPDEISFWLLQEGAEHLPGPLAEAARDPLLLNDAVGALRRYSLANASAGRLTVHRLVQAVVRDGLSEEEQRRWAEAAVRLVNVGFPRPTRSTDDVPFWPACAIRLPHALVSTDLAMALGVAVDEAADLLGKVGGYLVARAEHAAGHDCLRRAYRALEQAYGPDDPRIVAAMVNLAHSEAPGVEPVALLTRALAITERARGTEHVDVVNRLIDLGDRLTGRGDGEEAGALYERALAIVEGALGGDAPQLFRPLLALGGWLLSSGDMAGAEAVLERAATVMERAGGPEDRGFATCLLCLGGLRSARGEWGEAKACLERALAIREKAYAPDHPRVAWALFYTGFLMLATGEWEQARAYQERGLAVAEKAHGPDHPEVAWSLFSLGQTLRWLGEADRARPLLERALTICERVGGPAPLSASGPLSELGTALLDLGELASAKNCLERALSVHEHCREQEEAETARPLPSLARMHRMSGDAARARAYLERSLAIPEASPPENQHRLGATHQEYGLLLQAEGDSAGAREHLRQAVDAFGSAVGPRHPLTEAARRCLEMLQLEEAR